MFIHISFCKIVRDQVRGVQQKCQPNQPVEADFSDKSKKENRWLEKILLDIL